MSRTDWQVSDLSLPDSADVRALFESVFGSVMSAALWHWKYADGRGVAVGARAPDGALQAHCGGTRRVVLDGGQPIQAVQAGDMMVSPQGRSQLSHRGPFGLITDAFLDRHVGYDAAHLICFGFPNERHMRLGERLGIYTRMDEVLELLWPVPTAAASWLARSRRPFGMAPLHWADPTSTDRLNRLWAVMAADLRDCVVPQRDADWWRHRYANHPEHDYRCFWVYSRWTRRTLGVVALKVGHSAQPWELMDWLAPLDRAALMVQAACQVAGQAGAPAVMGWFSRRVVQQIKATQGAAQHACSVGLNTSRHRPGPGVERFLDRWWLTGGDTDFR